MVQSSMTNEEVQEILEMIIDYARALGWTSALAQDKDENILGMYIGQEAWINAKLGNTKGKHETH